MTQPELHEVLTPGSKKKLVLMLHEYLHLQDNIATTKHTTKGNDHIV